MDGKVVLLPPQSQNGAGECIALSMCFGPDVACCSRVLTPNRHIGSWDLFKPSANGLANRYPMAWMDPTTDNTYANFGFSCVHGHFTLSYYFPDEPLDKSPEGGSTVLVVTIDTRPQNLVASTSAMYASAELSGADLKALASTQMSLEVHLPTQATWAPARHVEGTAEALSALSTYCNN